jgi:hypothetical protein
VVSVIVFVSTYLFSALSEIELAVCRCRPAAEQLISRGLFPCSPLQPSMAADMQLLELITLSFLHLTLNITGWATLLEQFGWKDRVLPRAVACGWKGAHLPHSQGSRHA